MPFLLDTHIIDTYSTYCRYVQTWRMAMYEKRSWSGVWIRPRRCFLMSSSNSCTFREFRFLVSSSCGEEEERKRSGRKEGRG